MEFTGDFETHLTIHLDNPNRIQDLREWGSRHGLKCLHILLDRGDTASQPMLTRHDKGSLTDQLTTASNLGRQLQEDGFPVTRIKLEVPPWNPDVPQSDEEALLHPTERYFEHHIKLLLPNDFDSSLLASQVTAHTAHLSRNAIKVRADNYQERFVTQRCYAVGRTEARRCLYALIEVMQVLQYPIVEMEEEFVVYDSNLRLDAGWIR